MAKIGFIGLGVMGGELVNRLLDKGHSVTGFNRTEKKAERLIEKGMKWGNSPREVTAGDCRGTGRYSGGVDAGKTLRGYQHGQPGI